jgi:SAM-dependent methyltransferase
MSAEDFAGHAFAMPGGRCRRLTDAVGARVDPWAPLRILDIGCGTGELVFALAEALPRATLTGLDVSRPSIEAAQERQRRTVAGERLSFRLADYLAFDAGPFDVITASSTLHLIDTDADTLFTKIAADLALDGLLFNCMPCRCLYNHLLMGVRRAFRAVRHPVTDALIAWTARLLCGPKVTPEFLRQRIHYMYVIPRCYDGRALDELLENRCGLLRVETLYEPHASIAQPRHSLAIFRKQAADRWATGCGRPAA